ncbi:MAG: arginine--tRNA ligase, partial [Gammaproteobacteria bacterium]|nr:arginine--tRNA ligase [Gammaproteobacteria bacterium]
MRLRELQGESIAFPEDGYQAEYVKGLAEKLLEEDSSVAQLEEGLAIKRCSDFGVKHVLDWIKDDLKAFGITFDNWYSEQSLYDRDMVNTELGKLAEKGLSYQ